MKFEMYLTDTFSIVAIMPIVGKECQLFFTSESFKLAERVFVS